MESTLPTSWNRKFTSPNTSPLVSFSVFAFILIWQNLPPRLQTLAPLQLQMQPFCAPLESGPRRDQARLMSQLKIWSYEAWVDSWVGKIPWSRKWLPTPVFLLEKFRGQRSLAGYSPKCCKESDTTEHSRANSRIPMTSQSVPVPTVLGWGCFTSSEKLKRRQKSPQF